MVKRNRLRSTRPKAVFGADGALMAAATLGAAALNVAATYSTTKDRIKTEQESARKAAESAKLQREQDNKLFEQQLALDREQFDREQDTQKDLNQNLLLLAGQNNMNNMRENAKIQVKRGGSMRRKLRNTPTTFLRGRNGNLPFTVTDGGDVLPIGTTPEGYDLYEIIGNDHEHYHKAQGGKYKSGVGIKFPNGTIEGEGNQNKAYGEVMMTTPDDAMFFTIHNLHDKETGITVNPGKEVLNGGNPLEWFNIQESIKKRNGISDDGKSGSSTPVRRIRPYGGMTTLNVSPDLSLDFMAPVATGIIAGTRDEYFAGGDPTLKKRYPKEGPEAIYAIAKWREKHAIDGRPYPTTFIDRLNAYYDDKEYNHPMNNKKKDTNTVPKELKNIIDYYNFVEKYGDTRPYPRTINEKINEAIIERQERNQLKALQRQKDIESSSVYRKINQIDNDYLNNMFIHPSYEKTMRNPQGDTYGRRSLKKCGGRRKADFGTWYNGLNDTQKGNLWGAGFQTVGNLGGTLLTVLGNRAALKYSNAGNERIGNYLKDTWNNLPVISEDLINDNDYKAAHAFAALQAPNVKFNDRRARAERSLQRNLTRINNNTLSSAAAQNRNARAEIDYNDNISSIGADEYRANQDIVRQNIQNLIDVSKFNANADNEASRAKTNARQNLLIERYNQLRENRMGAAQYYSDYQSKIASDTAATRQANFNSFANAFNSSLSGFANTLATNAKMRNELEMSRYGWTAENNLNYTIRTADLDEAKMLYKRYKGAGGQYDIWANQLEDAFGIDKLKS